MHVSRDVSQIPSYFLNLTPEIVCKIFDYLPDLDSYLKVGTVCRRFNAIIRSDPSLKRRLEGIFGRLFSCKTHAFSELTKRFNPYELTHGKVSKIEIPFLNNGKEIAYQVNQDWLLIHPRKDSLSTLLLFFERKTSFHFRKMIKGDVQSVKLWQKQFLIVYPESIELHAIKEDKKLSQFSKGPNDLLLFSKNWLLINFLDFKTIVAYSCDHSDHKIEIDLGLLPEIGYRKIHENELLLISNTYPYSIFVFNLTYRKEKQKVFQYNLNEEMQEFKTCHFDANQIYIEFEDGPLVIDRHEISSKKIIDARSPFKFKLNKEFFCDFSSWFSLDEQIYPLALGDDEIIVSICDSIITTWDKKKPGINYRIPYYSKLLTRPLNLACKTDLWALDYFGKDIMVFFEEQKIVVLQKKALKSPLPLTKLSKRKAKYLKLQSRIFTAKEQLELSNDKLYKKSIKAEVRELKGKIKKLKKSFKNKYIKSLNLDEVDRLIYKEAYRYFKKGRKNSGSF